MYSKPKVDFVACFSEFDIAAVILHVGDVCISGRQKKQWVFVSDGCTWNSTLQYQGQLDCLLAISFRSPFTGNDLSALFSHHHEGTVVSYHIFMLISYSI